MQIVHNNGYSFTNNVKRYATGDQESLSEAEPCRTLRESA
jgi:hypothetical protein